MYTIYTPLVKGEGLKYPGRRGVGATYFKFSDGDGPNLCRVKKVDVSSTFIENIFRSFSPIIPAW